MSTFFSSIASFIKERYAPATDEEIKKQEEEEEEEEADPLLVDNDDLQMAKTQVLVAWHLLSAEPCT